jgi:hypothetical protein
MSEIRKSFVEDSSRTCEQRVYPERSPYERWKDRRFDMGYGLNDVDLPEGKYGKEAACGPVTTYSLNELPSFSAKYLKICPSKKESSKDNSS